MKPALVLVHGLACAGEDWASQRSRLQDAFDLHAPTLPGHGGTPGDPQTQSIELFGDAVVRRMAQDGLRRAVLVGHSMGCRVILEAFRREPARVAGLVLVDGSRMAEGDPEAAERAAHAALAAAGGFRAFAREFFADMFVGAPAYARPVIERALAMDEALGAASFARMHAWDARWFAPVLSACRAPVLVVQCTRMTPERRRIPLAAGDWSPYLDFVRRAAPAARIEILPGIGHFPMLDAPDALAALIGAFAREALA